MIYEVVAFTILFITVVSFIVYSIGHLEVWARVGGYEEGLKQGREIGEMDYRNRHAEQLIRLKDREREVEHLYAQARPNPPPYSRRHRHN